MSIALVISSLGTGGAERVLSLMANYWAEHGEDVTLITFSSPDEVPFYPLHKAVSLVPLDQSGSDKTPLRDNINRVTSLRAVIQQSGASHVLSFMDCTNVIASLACVGLPGVRLTIAERTHPAMYQLPAIWNILRILSYPLANNLVVQTESARSFFKGKLIRNLEVIPNPIPQCEAKESETNKADRRTICSAGRLVPSKGFDVLVKAFAQTAQSHPNWDLVVYGDGESRTNLQALVNSLGLTDRIVFPGITEDTQASFTQANVFAMASRFEGFPNVLCEAMACGLPVVSTNCTAGPSDIIQHDTNGMLVPVDDIDALSKALDALMTDEKLRMELGKSARATMTRFDIDFIMSRWNRAIGLTLDQDISQK